MARSPPAAGTGGFPPALLTGSGSGARPVPARPGGRAPPAPGAHARAEGRVRPQGPQQAPAAGGTGPACQEAQLSAPPGCGQAAGSALSTGTARNPRHRNGEGPAEPPPGRRPPPRLHAGRGLGGGEPARRGAGLRGPAAAVPPPPPAETPPAPVTAGGTERPLLSSPGARR